MKRPQAFEDSFTEDALYYIHTASRYNFEQSEMWLRVYNDTENIVELLNNENEFRDYIKDTWDNNNVQFFAESGADESRMGEIISEAKLSFEENLNVYTDDLEDGRKVGVIAIANDHSDKCAAYLVIISDSEGKAELFSAEYSKERGQYFPNYIGEEFKGEYSNMSFAEGDMDTAEKLLLYLDALIHNR